MPPHRATSRIAGDQELPPAPLTCGGIEGASCPDGYRCADDPADDCDPATGADCGGVCLLGEELPPCGGLGGEPCPEGYACTDDPNDDCDGGPAVDCPGVCTPAGVGECSSDAECPVLRAPCSVCADGSTSCPKSTCQNGACTVVLKPCPELPACGGIAGLPCEPGFECTDDPGDDCDPATGADCGGVCVPAEMPSSCGGLAGKSCPEGFECADDPRDDCDPTSGGADCPGVCEPAAGSECQADSDCPQLDVACSICPAGTAACPASFCVNGRCEVSYPSCPPPITCSGEADACKPGYVCADDPNDRCDPGQGDSGCPETCIPEEMPRACGGVAGETCPEGWVCTDSPNDGCDPDASGADCPGVCEPAPTPECQSDEECPRILAPCTACPDGSFACPVSYCRDGRCEAVIESCPNPGFCGGIAGFPCLPGYTCVDDPGDDCDPEQGGADCGGICVREDKPRSCGGFAGEVCPESYECADDPGDDCDPENGGADCPGICQPAPSPGCMTDADCPQVGAPCRICPDGTAACPTSFCENGACQVTFGGCVVED
jgi:hypothetical protein